MWNKILSGAFVALVAIGLCIFVGGAVSLAMVRNEVTIEVATFTQGEDAAFRAIWLMLAGWMALLVGATGWAFTRPYTRRELAGG